MKARDHQHVKGAGALEPDAQRMREVGAVTGHHCSQHYGIFGSQAQRRRQVVHGGGQCQQARRGSVLQCVNAASQECARAAGLADVLYALDWRRWPWR